MLRMPAWTCLAHTFSASLLPTRGRLHIVVTLSYSKSSIPSWSCPWEAPGPSRMGRCLAGIITPDYRVLHLLRPTLPRFKDARAQNLLGGELYTGPSPGTSKRSILAICGDDQSLISVLDVSRVLVPDDKSEMLWVWRVGRGKLCWWLSKLSTLKFPRPHLLLHAKWIPRLRPAA